MQIIRGTNLMKDGRNKWYDVSKTPDDLISYREIKNWNNESKKFKTDKKTLEAILPNFDLFDVAQNGPLTEKDKKKLVKIEALKKEKLAAMKEKKRKQKKQKSH